MRGVAALAALASLLAACTQDFGTFGFEAHPAPDSRDAMTGGPSDASTASDGGGGRGAGDSGGADADGAPDPSADASSGAGGSNDGGGAGAVADDAGSAGDAASDAGDAGGEPDPACTAAWDASPPGSESCRDCACQACSAPVLACFSQGTTDEQALCQSVLACALQYGCRDDCYCATAQCGAPDPSGDGPCVSQMNAAAGGTRYDVNQILAAASPSEPLVRAMDAVYCLLGESRHEPGMCELTCR